MALAELFFEAGEESIQVAVEANGFVLVRLGLPHDREPWFQAIASGRGFGELPQNDRRRLEPWALSPRPASPAP